MSLAVSVNVTKSSQQPSHALSSARLEKRFILGKREYSIKTLEHV